MKKIIPLLVVVLLAVVAWKVFPEPIADLYHVAAGNLLRNTNPEAAADHFSKKLLHVPHRASLHQTAADLYRQAGNLTRAEYILQHAVQWAGSAAFTPQLSAVYVEQDKLLDASKLDTPNRPALPVPQPEPGLFHEQIALSFDVPPGQTVYFTLDGSVPSVEHNRYDAPVDLPPGASNVCAVAVEDATGLVSPILYAEYNLEDIVLPVVCRDAAIEAVLRNAVGKPEGYLFTEDLWALTALEVAEPTAYTTLEDLANCKNLQKLTLVGDRTPCALTGLETLQSLTALTLNGFGVTARELDAIAALVNLKTLNLAENRIADPSALFGLTNLQTLDLSQNNITSAAGIAALANLKTLNLARNVIAETAPFDGLSTLQTLDLSENRLIDVAGLQTCTALQTLDISRNLGLAAIDPVCKLPKLKILNAGHCAIAALPAKGVSLPNVTEIDISYNVLTTVKPLAGCKKLKRLHVQGTPEKDAKTVFDRETVEILG